jgi:hypothetical protein
VSRLEGAVQVNMVGIGKTTLLDSTNFIATILAFYLGLRGVALALELVRRHVLGANVDEASV